MADVLDGDEMVLVEQRRSLRVAEERAAAARTRLRVLRAAARRAVLVRWHRLAVATAGLGVLAAVFVLAAAAVLVLVPGPLLVAPAGLALVAVVVVTRRLRGRPEPQSAPGWDAAAAEADAARTAVRRARARLAARARRLRGEVALWCRRHGIPADARALRRLARQADRRHRHALRGRPRPG